MESLPPELQKLVTEVASKDNIKNFTLEVNKSVSKDGDGYIGILNGLSIIDKDSDKKLDLVVKTAPKNENLRKQFPTRQAFVREICMYDEVFPELLKFQEKYNISNPFKSITKMYGSISEEFKEVLLLKNLKEEGYELCNRQEPMDVHHLSLVITEYAKLHALTHAMRILEPEQYKKIKKLVGAHPMADFAEKMSKQEGRDDKAPWGSQMDMFYAPTMEAIKDKPKLVEAVERFKKVHFQKMENMMKQDEYAVVSHGDCWSANLLFKYEDKENPKIPTKLCLIDWQLSSMISPIHDLSYFFYISAGKNDLENYMRYLHVYHTAMSETLKSFGLSAEDVYPFELLEEQWNEKSSMGFSKCLVLLQLSLSEGKAHDFEELAKEGISVIYFKDRKSEISDLFRQRMGDLIEFLADHNFI